MLFLAANQPNMLKRLSFIAVAAVAILASCKKDPDYTVYTKSAPMTAAQVVPTQATPSAASGTVTGSYDVNSKTLTYSLSWTGLSSDSIRSIRLHGPAEVGYAAPAVQTTSAPANPLTTASPFPLKAAGSWSQSIKADESVVKEADILANRFYVQIYTKAYPAGELRGTVVVQ